MPSPSPFAVPALLAAVVSSLKADTALTALLAEIPAGFGSGPAVYGETTVPPKAGYPYVSVGAPTEIPLLTFGEFGGGSECTFHVKPVSAAPNEDELYSLGILIKDRLDNADLPVSGFSTAEIAFEILPDLLVESVRGVLVRSLPIIFRAHLSGVNGST
jgi:Protein of unknown function (DUF3168)